LSGSPFCETGCDLLGADTDLFVGGRSKTKSWIARPRQQRLSGRPGGTPKKTNCKI